MTLKNNENKYNTTNKKKNTIMSDSLYKDLKEINNNLENRNEYFKKHHYNLDYQKHYGDEKTCPICKEMRQKAKIMEKEKGLFNAFTFRNYKTIKRKSLNKLKLSRIKKNQTEQLDLLSDENRKKNNIYNWNNFKNLNISQQNLEFRQKYMQFNGMNRLQRIKRYGSIDNYIKNNNNSRNDNKHIFNEGRLFEKKEEDIFNNSEYPVLKNYFHGDNNSFKNNNFFS